MSCFLYVYDISNLDLFRKKKSKHNFISVAYLFNISSSVEDIGEISLFIEDNPIVDITNVFKNSSIDTIFFERYLLALMKNTTNIHFSLQSIYLNEFKSTFPYMFSEEKLNYEYDLPVKELVEKNISQKTIAAPLILYTYKSQVTIVKLYEKKLAISLSNLLQEDESFLSIENIKKPTIENSKYIDLSTVVKTLKSRNDLIFQVEILIYRLSIIKNAKFSIQDNLRKDVIEMFPLLFINEESMDGSVHEKELNHDDREIDVSEINSWVDKINEKLKGHIIFKKDFRHNLLKFLHLNKMKERKILSILLCGESGIGKTEFAKIVSNIIYPNEMLIKINFGNYSTEGVLNSLIGSPLGYVGSKEGGELINKITFSNSKVILIDEFEKATSSVFNFFYELLEDGKFTDRQGVEHDLNKYIIIFTSNMTEFQYLKQIPDPLKSRFDMVYNFESLESNEKRRFIYQTAQELIENLRREFGYEVNFKILKDDIDKLIVYNNLREIKRRVEDVVFKDILRRL